MADNPNVDPGLPGASSSDLVAALREMTAAQNRTTQAVVAMSGWQTTTPTGKPLMRPPDSLEGASSSSNSPPITNPSSGRPSSSSPSQQSEQVLQSLVQNSGAQGTGAPINTPEQRTTPQQNGPNAMQRFGDWLQTNPVTGPPIGAAQTVGGIQVPGTRGETLAGVLGMGAGFNILPQLVGSAVQQASTFANPLSWNATGTSYGLQGGSPLTIPGTTIGIQSPFGGGGGLLSPAASEQVGNIRDAISSGVQPGTSFAGGLEFNSLLEQMGWHGDIQNRMSDARTQIAQQVGGENRLPSSQTLAQVADEWVRQGTGSMTQFVNVMSQIPDAAVSAAMSVDQMTQAIDQTANSLQNQGLTYSQGATAATQFASAFHMDPQIMSQVMGNQFWQANAMGQYGLLPEQQGLIAQQPGAFSDLTYHTMRQMENIYKGSFQTTSTTDSAGIKHTFTASQKAQAEVAHQLGMTPDELKRFQNNRQAYTIGSDLENEATKYNRQVKAIQHNFARDGHDPNSGLTQQGRELIRQLDSGTGAYKGSGYSWHDITQLAREKGSPISHQELKQMWANPQDRQKVLDQLIGQNKQPFNNQQGNVTLDLTPAAKKLVQTMPDATSTDHMRNANAGNTQMNKRYYQPIPNSNNQVRIGSQTVKLNPGSGL